MSASAAVLSNINPTTAVEVSLDETQTPPSSKTPRLPRWTRQEILVLIEGKRVVENHVRRGRASFGTGQVEPKWASVSSYCKRHGVSRRAVQCRKRWSNLAGDYKKIKEWEDEIKEESESFWVMRNDLRRDRKLPGFFDREVYDIMDGVDLPNVVGVTTGLALRLGPTVVDGDAEAVFDSGRSSAVGGAENGLFSDGEEDTEEDETTFVAAPVPISGVETILERKKTLVKDAGQLVGARKLAPEKLYQPLSSTGQGVDGDANEPLVHHKRGSSSQDDKKRKRYSVNDGDTETATLSLQDRLIDVLEQNGKMLHSQLQVHNNNMQLDREQRKDNAANLVEVLNKMANAMMKIAEKL